MSKLKVKKEVLEQLELLISNHAMYENKSLLLEEHYLIINSNGDELWDVDKYNLLNNLSFSEMYDLSHDNYEIELDAEDEIRELYYYKLNELSKFKILNNEWSAIRGYLDGMNYVLRKLKKEYIIEKFPDKKSR